MARSAARVGICTVGRGRHGSPAHVSGPAPPGSLPRPLTSLYLWSPGQQVATPLGFVGSASHTPGHAPKPAQEGEGLRHHGASPWVRSIGKGPVTWRPGESVWLEKGRICPAPWRGFPNRCRMPSHVPRLNCSASQGPERVFPSHLPTDTPCNGPISVVGHRHLVQIYRT